MINREEVYLIWAPDSALWSRWAKPVLFAEMTDSIAHGVTLGDWRLLSTTGMPRPEERHAAVVELPGAQSVAWGMALAAAGYRPVPLFNAAAAMTALVEVETTRRELLRWAPDLGALRLPPDAPPAFLLDEARRGGGRAVAPGRFDNRSVLFPQDFPSADFLLGHGIRGAIVLRRGPGSVQSDLAQVLYRWQENRIPLFDKSPDDARPPEPLTVSRPMFVRSLWYRLMVLAGLRRNSAGGFGSIVPEPSSHHGYG